jgi:hypothetical protein
VQAVRKSTDAAQERCELARRRRDRADSPHPADAEPDHSDGRPGSPGFAGRAGTRPMLAVAVRRGNLPVVCDVVMAAEAALQAPR